MVLAVDQERWRRSEAKLEQKTRLAGCWLHLTHSRLSRRTALHLSYRSYPPLRPACVESIYRGERHARHALLSLHIRVRTPFVPEQHLAARRRTEFAAPESKLLTQLVMQGK